MEMNHVFIALINFIYSIIQMSHLYNIHTGNVEAWRWWWNDDIWPERYVIWAQYAFHLLRDAFKMQCLIFKSVRGFNENQKYFLKTALASCSVQCSRYDGSSTHLILSINIEISKKYGKNDRIHSCCIEIRWIAFNCTGLHWIVCSTICLWRIELLIYRLLSAFAANVQNSTFYSLEHPIGTFMWKLWIPNSFRSKWNAINCCVGAEYNKWLHSDRFWIWDNAGKGRERDSKSRSVLQTLIMWKYQWLFICSECCWRWNANHNKSESLAYGALSLCK